VQGSGAGVDLGQYAFVWPSAPEAGNAESMLSYATALAYELDRLAKLPWDSSTRNLWEQGAFDLYSGLRLWASTAEGLRVLEPSWLPALKQWVAALAPHMKAVGRLAAALEQGMIDDGRARVAAAREAADTWMQKVATWAENIREIIEDSGPPLLLIAVGLAATLILTRR